MTEAAQAMTEDGIEAVRNLRYVSEMMRSELKGLKVMDARNKKGRQIKDIIEDAHLSQCVVRDRLTAVLRVLGDKPLEGEGFVR